MRRISSPLYFPTRSTLIEDAKAPTQKRVNQYYLTGRVGNGATSKVYQAIDDVMGNRYAIKCISRCGRTGYSALERELRIMSKLNHPNIVRLIESLWSATNKRAYLVLEFANCSSLQHQIINHVKFSEPDIASIISQITAALQYLISNSIVHRDLKPANILLFSDGTVKLSDFGIGHSFQSANTIVGTPAYQAPEVFDDEEDGSVIDPVKEDVWSFGITLYETIFGTLPYTGQNIFEIVSHIYSTPINITGVSEQLKDLLTGMLQPHPANRLSVEDIAKHPFVLGAPAAISHVKLIPILQKPVNYNIPTINIKAMKIEEGFCFTKYERTQSLDVFIDEDHSWIGSPVVQQMSSSISIT